MENKYCVKCGWSSNENYCYKDGYELVKWETCKCGKNIAPSDLYCTKCGTITNRGKRVEDEQMSPIREAYDDDEMDEAREIEAEIKADNDRETIAGI